MILVVDAGNSNLVLGAYSAAQLDETSRGALAPAPQKTWRLPTHPLLSAADLKARVSALAPGARAIVLASVVPAVTERFREAYGSELLVIDSSWPFSFRIATEQPARTGIDRLVNAEAAARRGLVPCILVDAGTATTVCALAAGETGPVFLGGAILPGIEACRDTLAQRGAQLHAVELKAPPRAIGRSTDEALRSGVVLGYAAMLDGLVRRFRDELGDARVPVLATGGASLLLRGACQEPAEHDPDLTLKGILHLYASFHRR